jgi:ribosomal protein S18 acetylase RimI-like enzyme
VTPPAGSAPLAFELRPAKPDDAEGIAEVWHASWLDGHLGHVPEALHEHRRPEDFRRRVPPRIPHITVAVAAGRLVGFVAVRGDEVEQLFVAAEARGAGVAAALLDSAESGIALGHDLAWLSVAAGNARARRFYEKSGWQRVAAFDYPAETRDGVLLVPSLRYEKRLGAGTP